jgi:hypothetical protein
MVTSYCVVHPVIAVTSPRKDGFYYVSHAQKSMNLRIMFGTFLEKSREFNDYHYSEMI